MRAYFSYGNNNSVQTKDRSRRYRGLRITENRNFWRPCRICGFAKVPHLEGKRKKSKGHKLLNQVAKSLFRVKAQSDVTSFLSDIFWDDQKQRRQTHSKDQVLWFLAWLLPEFPILWLLTHSFFDVRDCLLQSGSPRWFLTQSWLLCSVAYLR